MDRSTFRAPAALIEAAKEHAEDEGYPNYSEYLRSLIRDDVPKQKLRKAQRERRHD